MEPGWERLPLAIAAVVRRGDGKYLLIRRGFEVPAPGIWAIVTGRIEPGEEVVEAVRREVREEVGLWVRAGEVVHRCPTADGKWLLLWHETTLDDPAQAMAPLNVAPREIADARWLTAAEATTLDPIFPATRAFFARLAQAEAAGD